MCSWANSCLLATNAGTGAAVEGVSSGVSPYLETKVGIRGITSSPNGFGVWGQAAPSVAGTGVYGDVVEGTGIVGDQYEGVAPLDGSPGDAGVFGRSTRGRGVWGYHFDPNGSPGFQVPPLDPSEEAGVLGMTNSNTPFAAAVRGISGGTNPMSIGVFGSAGTGTGVAGLGRYVGVLGWNYNGAQGGLAGYFYGNLAVTGTLTKGAGAFRIDHPLDPAHKYLQHSFVESPDMKDVYDGVVTTNAHGFATVRLPAYFEALNKDFRYQLTIVGTRGWRARVVQEITHNRFTIQSDEPNVKVSWQVTGIRHDPYANAHRIQVVVPKQGAADGRYLHPDLYGQPASKSVVPKAVRRAEAQTATP